MPNNRRRYDEEFKKRAVRLSYGSERTVRAVAESLGIHENMLHRWRKIYTPDGDKTQMAQQHDELQKIRHRIAELEEENDISYVRTGEGFDYLCQVRDVLTNTVLAAYQTELMKADLVA